MGVYWSIPFQVLLDAGFRKAPIHKPAVAWFERVRALPAFVKVMGHVKMTDKPQKPILKPEEKKPKAAAVEKPKKEVEEVKEEKRDWESTLVDSDLPLYDFKTFFTNEPDKEGAGMAKTKEHF